LGDVITVFGKITATAAGAKDTAAIAYCAISIGAGKAAVDGQLVYFAAKFFPVMLGQGFVHRHHLCKFYALRSVLFSIILYL
jgi:hypothetical protein